MSMNVKLKMKTLVKLYDEMHDIKGECVACLGWFY